MRAVLDARTWWVNVMHHKIVIPSHTTQQDPFITISLRDASILKVCGFKCLAFTGRAFLLEAKHDGVPAQAILDQAQAAEGQTPQQWMLRMLLNFEHLLQIARVQPPVISQREGDQTLILRADATPATVDKFHALL
jgi:hypothetical protein